MRLHPKYGLNPTMPVCIFCGKDKGEIALLGAAYDGEAPPKMVMDDQPCDACAEQWKQGIALIEHNGKNATGRMVLLTEEGTRKIITKAEVLAQVLERRAVLLNPETFSSVFGATA